jgi:hypothetical protein
MEMFAAHAMVHTSNIAFDIGNERINPRQDSHRISAILHHHPLMGALIFVDYVIPRPSIRRDLQPCGKDWKKESSNTAFNFFQNFLNGATLITYGEPWQGTLLCVDSSG